AKRHYTAARKASALKAKQVKAGQRRPGPSAPLPVPMPAPATAPKPCQVNLPRASTVQSSAQCTSATPVYAPLVRTVSVPGTSVELYAAKRRAKSAYIPLRAWAFRAAAKPKTVAKNQQPAEPALTANEALVENSEPLPGRTGRREILVRQR
ncbi:unnamed protein product, partial [Symbiodinium pilosum]